MIHTHLPWDTFTAGSPRFASPPSPDCSGSLWGEVKPWLTGQGITLRPWQESVMERALEVDGNGDRLTWRTVVVSTPRQQGKSWLIRAAAMLRAQFPDLFGGEPQAVAHVANNHRAAKRIHSMAWGWAADAGLVVRTAEGQERIVWPDGGAWDALTLTSVYGSTANLVLLDEIWDVRTEHYREGLRPTQRARRWPQMWALSTAHRRATPLMGELMADAVAGIGRTLLMDWGAAAGDDPMDPAIWAKASPWWDEQTFEELQVEAGREGFAEQSLNIWPDSGDNLRWIAQSFTERAAAGKVLKVPPQSAVFTVECSMDGHRWAAAAAWQERRGIAVRVWLGAFDECMARIPAGRQTRAHRAVVESVPLDRRWGWESVTEAQHRSATVALRDAVRAGSVRVAGVPDEQWAAVRATPRDGGEMIDAARSTGDVYAIKAAAWAVWAVQSGQSYSELVQ